MKRRRWGFKFDEDQLYLLTPLFFLWISDGGYDWMTCASFWGMKLSWGLDRNAPTIINPWRHTKIWTFGWLTDEARCDGQRPFRPNVVEHVHIDHGALRAAGFFTS